MEPTHSKKTALWACLVLVGLQFLFPISLKAAGQPAVLEAYGTLLGGHEDEGLETGQEDCFELYTLMSWHRDPCGIGPAVRVHVERNSDRLGIDLLPVSGRQPSAP